MRTILILTIMSMLVISCGSDGPRYNVLLIGIDTLRPDHLGCYGYDLPTSPNIDTLAEDGVVFEAPVSQCPWTLPSFASTLTSLYPTQHGAGMNMSAMGTDFPTLASILAGEGYATGAVLSCRVLSPEFGVDRGFQYYDVNSAEEARDADNVTELALNWLGGLDRRPFFLFLHYFDPHLPYAPPAPYTTMFYDGPVTSIGSSFDVKTLIGSEVALQSRLAAITPREWERITSLYDGEIGFTDRSIGRLLSGLRDRGLARNTLIVLFSDHGEELYEHGGLGHGHTLYNEVIRVPLIFSLAGVLPRGKRVRDQVRTVDVLPTVLEVLELESGYRFEGVSLVGMMEGESRESASEGRLFPTHMAYSEGLRRGSERKGISAYPWKLVHDADSDSAKFFNLIDDPGEMKPNPGPLPESVALMKDVLLKNLMKMEDTWYIDMVPGHTTCRFDVRISVEQDLSSGRITFCRYLTEGGVVLDPHGACIERSRLVLEGVAVEEPLTLAFQIDAPPGLPVTFDLSIDGESAADRTYLGEKLLQAERMPLSLYVRRRGLTATGPLTEERPPPYFVIRRSESRGPVRPPTRLGTETEKELRALGYIQ